MKILNDDGPLWIEDHDSKMVVVHKATGKPVHEWTYYPGRIDSYTIAFATARGFQLGWQARKDAQYRGESE